MAVVDRFVDLPFATRPEVTGACTPASVDHVCLEDDKVLSMTMPSDSAQHVWLSFKLPVQCPVSVSIFSHRPL